MLNIENVSLVHGGRSEGGCLPPHLMNLIKK